MAVPNMPKISQHYIYMGIQSGAFVLCWNGNPHQGIETKRSPKTQSHVKLPLKPEGNFLFHIWSPIIHIDCLFNYIWLMTVQAMLLYLGFCYFLVVILPSSKFLALCILVGLCMRIFVLSFDPNISNVKYCTSFSQIL